LIVLGDAAGLAECSDYRAGSCGLTCRFRGASLLVALWGMVVAVSDAFVNLVHRINADKHGSEGMNTDVGFPPG
jgi:hypothetical protein